MTDLGGDGLCATLADVSHNDVRPLLSKELSGRLAEARPGTGYQCGFACQSHINTTSYTNRRSG